MKTKLVIYLLFAVYSSTDCYVPSSKESVSSSESDTLQKITKCNEDVALSNIKCMSNSDHEQLWGGMVRYGIVQMWNSGLLREAVRIIGEEEMKKALNISNQSFNETIPSKEDIDSAPTAEAYFNLIERTDNIFSKRSSMYPQFSFTLTVKFLDKRVPEIRTIFKCIFEKLSNGVVERKTVDDMITEFMKVLKKVYKAIEPMTSYNCWFHII